MNLLIETLAELADDPVVRFLVVITLIVGFILLILLKNAADVNVLLSAFSRKPLVRHPIIGVSHNVTFRPPVGALETVSLGKARKLCLRETVIVYGVQPKQWNQVDWFITSHKDVSTNAILPSDEEFIVRVMADVYEGV